MKLVTRSEILELGEYEKVRDHFRTRVIAEKKARRFAAGSHLSVLFENHDTVLLQIQEMLRTERITRESSVEHEITTYNELLGGPNELGATVMIEIVDAAERDAFLARARGIEQHFVLEVGSQSFRARWDESRALGDQASAVIYLKFPLTEAGARALAAKDAHVFFVVDHPDVALRTPLSAALVRSLAEDLAE